VLSGENDLTLYQVVPTPDGAATEVVEGDGEEETEEVTVNESRAARPLRRKKSLSKERKSSGCWMTRHLRIKQTCCSSPSCTNLPYSTTWSRGSDKTKYTYVTRFKPKLMSNTCLKTKFKCIIALHTWASCSHCFWSKIAVHKHKKTNNNKTYTGKIVVAVNPFKKLPLYSTEEMDKYALRWRTWLTRD
jgi:hypothetical protein